MSNVETVRRLYQAFMTRDLETVLQLLDPSVEWGQPESLPWGGTYRGPEQVMHFFGKVNQYVEGLRVDTEEYLEADGTVVALGWVRGVARRTGASFSVRLAHVWKFRDGKVVWFLQLRRHGGASSCYRRLAYGRRVSEPRYRPGDRGHLVLVGRRKRGVAVSL